MRLFYTLISFVVLSVAVSGYAVAKDAHDVEHLAFGAGYFDVINGDEGAAQFSAEYRGNYVWQGIRPVVGISVDHQGGVYGYGGANWDVFIADDWVLAPNFMVGGYHQGDSKDLGHALEFRSGLEVDYVMEDESRVGVTFNHISNASIGDKNPGSESLMLVYSHPIYMWGE